MSEDAFSTLMASVDPPLVVLTTVADDEWAGCLVGFHAQSSITPQHYCVWLSKANHTYRVALRATHFAVHYLTPQDFAVAEHFGTLTGEDTDKFADVDVDVDPNGVPLLRACPSRMSLERIALLDDGGDHVCLTTRVVSAHSDGDFVPLRVSGAAHLEPGHASEERAIQP
ncbi:flavin reductase (DIM6/NTAB) family NADH-FMN oxidoreductase RutF [Nocardioides ginsengisegetis]|uniref:Flavin reductase (DIM6/NTAB) family NADH-FMN oxidoreductase RutF n=1 Tax=Nocardioides ginsengisegetis TaxID=661491 RepID=A0A7W3J318_9ACTN|nr:flavin reductase family protein [Nocardioides ginsengisegetis]MBA8805371.1 flavin reductase (DIM6/NTAB) family NADH-FMN oxidoreductase RutF [Nocardioides ginsengisegetis]